MTGPRVEKSLQAVNFLPDGILGRDKLRRLFEACGQVVQVNIIRDRVTGLPRGFALWR
jgi:hypothetical protein